MKISFTTVPGAELLESMKAKRKAERVKTLLPPELDVVDSGKDVTRTFIKGPPGDAKQKHTAKLDDTHKSSRNVWVVHGRDLKIRNAMFSFLHSLDLHPLEWSEAVKETGKPTPYVGEVLDAAFSRARAIVVVFTPDDEAKLRKHFIKDDDEVHEKQLTPQARPNVLFEAGMAFGKDQDRTILVQVGNLRPFSNTGGRHILKVKDSSSKWRHDLANRLEAAGCVVNRSGSEWLDAGDFTLDNVTDGMPDGEEDESGGRLEPDEKIDVGYSYYVEYRNKVTARLIKTVPYAENCELGWGDVYIRLGNCMASPSSVSQLEASLNELLKDELAKKLQQNHPSGRVRHLKIKTADFQAILSKLKSMGLLEYCSDLSDQQTAYWKLSVRGQTELNNLRDG
ncbi:MAG: nucleotide-binding protein [Candidatus Zixiibacteriota bacterium]